MRWMKHTLFYLVLISILVVFFAPKRQLYYLAEEHLNSYDIVYSKEFVDDSGFVLRLSDGTLYYQDLQIAKINEITLMPLLVYNRANIAPFSLSDEMSSFLPGTISSVSATHTIISPLSIKIEASGDFGTLDADVWLLDRNISLRLTPTQDLLDMNPIWLRQMRKTDDGGYSFETTF